MRDLEIFFLPAQWRAPAAAEWAPYRCAVIDVLRATSNLVTCLAHGALFVRPVATVEEAFAQRTACPGALLAGERDGLPLPGFDFGNSPSEATRARVEGRPVILTTTNGTQALVACAAAQTILAASFLNLSAVAERLLQLGPPWRIVCAGRNDEFGLDDAIVAGALAAALGAGAEDPFVAIYRSVQDDLAGAFRSCGAGAELLQLGMSRDLDFCLDLDRYDLVPTRQPDGTLRLE